MKAKVRKGDKEETWIVSREAAYKLSFQDREIDVIEEFKGEKLIGKYVKNPVTGDEVIILPAEFVDPDNATGVVMSVPAHAPFDHIALEDLKKESEILLKYDIDPRVVEEISYISLISLEATVSSRRLKRPRGSESRARRTRRSLNRRPRTSTRPSTTRESLR